MSRRRFYATRVEGDQAWVEGQQAQHLAQVLRAQPGQLYEVAHTGRAWLGRIVTVNRDAIGFALQEELAVRPEGPQVEVAAAIVRFDPFEWMLEKTTELGVSVIHPLVTRRTEPHLAQAALKRAQRWQRILVAATQQSRRTQPPRLSHPCVLPEFLQQGAGEAGMGALRLVASEIGGAPPLRTCLEAGGSPDRCVVLIGPEGGWGPDEVEAAATAGFLPFSLGPRILRAETAAVASLAIVQGWWEPAGRDPASPEG